MNLGRTVIAALVMVCGSGVVQALPTYEGSWNLSDAGALNRGIWFEGHDLYTTDFGTFTTTGNTAALSGNVSQGAGGFTFNVSMNHLCSSNVTNVGGKEVSVDNNADCGGLGYQPTGGPVTGADVDGQMWDFWNWDGTGSLTGFGDLSGLTAIISQAPSGGTKPFRVGPGANWDDGPSVFGGSGWFSISGWGCQVGVTCDSFRKSSGDFNFTMTSVPEPGSLALLGLGLLGLGVVRRRKS